MSMMKEFKEFAMRGNVIDLAVGLVLGVAFGRIVTVLVERVIMPPIGLLIGGIDFNDLVITLREATAQADAVTIGIGELVNALIQFVIVAFAIFMVVKTINRMKRTEPAPPEPAPAEPSEEAKLLREIRDALRTR